MTTSLPSTPLNESALGATAGSTAAPTLLDLFSALPGGTTPDGTAPLNSAPVMPADFASLLAPATSVPSHATPLVPAQPLTPVTNVVATPMAATPTRAQRLDPTTLPEPASTRPTALPVESSVSGHEGPLDRALHEAALALLATILPSPPPPPQPPVMIAPAAGQSASVPMEADAGEGQSSAWAPPAHWHVTLSTPAGELPMPLAQRDFIPDRAARPLPENVPGTSPEKASAALAQKPTPSSTPAEVPVLAAPLPASAPPRAERTPLQPVQAELEWESGLKLSAECAPAKPAPIFMPATATGNPVHAAAGNRMTSDAAAAATTARPGPMPVQAEKNADSLPVAPQPARSVSSSTEKNFLTLAPSEVTVASSKAGIDVAQLPSAMPAASHHLPNAVASALPVAASATMPRAEVSAAPAPEQTAQRAVETVLAIVHAQVVSKLQPVPSVQLRFKVGHEDLAVRVQLRDGEVRTEFRTDNAELRAAVAQEWRAVTAKPEAALRFLEPVITTANPTAQHGGTAGQGGSAFQQQQQQAQQQQQQQFRTQMEFFGSVRRTIPAASAPAELAPVTPLVAAAASHRLSAVA